MRPAGSINTAFQLVAVIFQLQSLQQFGGVSATHLDWTMVPYVRKSFYKHYLEGAKWIDGSETSQISNSMSIDEYPSGKCFDYALVQTQKELEQAVEGL